MSYRSKIIAAALLSLSALLPAGLAGAADLPVKAVKPPPDLPFFLLIDDRLTYSYMPKGTNPGAFSINPNGTINGTTAKNVYSFTHFDVWGYGTNFFTISLFKADHNAPANTCTNAGQITSNTIGGGFATVSADCAGYSEIYGLFRSTFGFNELFNTKSFTYGPLHNVSFEVGMDANTENNFLAPAKRDVVAGLQFAFDLPYKGYFNVAPLVYWEFSNHNAFAQCNSGFSGPTPGVHTGPSQVRTVLDRHPGLKLIIAHLGMPEYSEFLDLCEEFDGVHLDTTMAFTPFIEETMPFPPAELPRLAELGDRILFGSDFPNIPYRYAESLNVLTKVAADDDWLRKVLYHNAARVFDLEDQLTEATNRG